MLKRRTVLYDVGCECRQDISIAVHKLVIRLTYIADQFQGSHFSPTKVQNERCVNSTLRSMSLTTWQAYRQTPCLNHEAFSPVVIKMCSMTGYVNFMLLIRYVNSFTSYISVCMGRIRMTDHLRW